MISILLLGSAITVLCSCGAEPEKSPEPLSETAEEEELVPRSLDSPSMQFLPREEEVEGWRLVSDPSVYPASILDRYLSQSAEKYRRYDLIDLTVGEYETTRGEGFAFLEIFRFPDFVQAFGAFSEQRSPDATTFDVENLGMKTRGVAIIWRGPFLIRAIGQNAGTDATLEDLATTTIGGMPSAPGLPGAFRFLPSRNRVDHSERFARDQALGQPYLANSFVADFRVDDETVTGLVLPAPGREAAALILDTWASFFEANGRILDSVPNLGEDNFTAEEQFMGRTAAFRIDRFVVIFNGFTNRQALVDMAIDSQGRILRRIQDALRGEQQ